MVKVGKGELNELPFTLYSVAGSEENSHAETTFIRCTNGREFAVTEQGYCDSGEFLLAEWGGSKLVALFKVTVEDEAVKVVQCLKGGSVTRQVMLSQVTDRRQTTV